MSSSRQVDLYADPDQLRMDGLIRWVRAECDALEAILPAAVDAQWQRPPVRKASDDTTERSKGGHSDPTSAIALDDVRSQLRSQVLNSEHVLRTAIVALRGVRRGLERRLEAWEGDC